MGNSQYMLHAALYGYQNSPPSVARFIRQSGDYYLFRPPEISGGQGSVKVKILAFFACFSGFDTSIYVELYDGDDSVVTKMVEAGFATRMHPSPSTVQFHELIDPNPVSAAASSSDELEYVLIPG